MSEIKEQFVSYEILLKLKELGFDEPCLAYFESVYNGLTQKYTGKLVLGNKPEHLQSYKKLVYLFGQNKQLAPLYSQVIDWFREKHGIDIEIHSNFGHGCSWWANLCYNPTRTEVLNVGMFNNYYEAREKAILKAIELCQKEK